MDNYTITDTNSTTTLGHYYVGDPPYYVQPTYWWPTTPYISTTWPIGHVHSWEAVKAFRDAGATVVVQSCSCGEVRKVVVR